MELIYAILGLVVWITVSYFIFQKHEHDQLIESAKKLDDINKKIIDSSEKLYKKEEESRSIIDQAKKEASAVREEVLSMRAKAEWKLETLESKEKDLDKKFQSFELKENKLEEEKNNFKEEKKKHEDNIISFKNEKIQTLEKIAKLTEQEAQERLIKETEEKSRSILLAQMNKIEGELKDEAQKKATKIISQAIQKYSSEVASESTATVVEIESDEMKWRIIWREWRNINALELATWVDVIIDDTPNSIIISWFDLFRRYIAKKTIEKLIEDWRIHPARIEELAEKTRIEANTMLKDLWEKAAQEIWITWIHSDLLKIVWRLRFRTSYGQNILKHSLEVWYLCANIAWEIWVDVEKAKLAWFFHDIWKAVDHEIEWSHAEIWYAILKKYKIPEDVAYAVWAHHEDMPVLSPLDFIVCAADAISWSRPWARRESMDTYVKRLRTLEDIANSFEWVEKAFAIQAWREIRILVQPEKIDDYQAKTLALNVTQKIEKEMSYPWQIKVNVIRETRVSEYAK